MKKLSLIFALSMLSPLAWANTCTLPSGTYATLASTAGQWTGTGCTGGSYVAGSGDVSILANGVNLTIASAETWAIGSSPITSGTSAIACASGAGTAILTVNGTLDLRGPVSQCNATWQVNPQSAAASTTCTWSMGSNSFSCSAGTGIVVGQLMLGIGIMNGTLVSTFSGTSGTFSQFPHKAGSGTTVSFFPPSIIFDSSMAAAPTTTTYAWSVTYAACSTAPCAVLDLNGTLTDPVLVTNVAGDANSGGFQNASPSHGSGAVNATYTTFNNIGTASLPATFFYNFGGPTGQASSITNSTYVASGMAEDLTYANNVSFIFNGNTCLNPINATGYCLENQNWGGETGITVQIKNNYFDGIVKEFFGTSSYNGTDIGSTVNGNWFSGISTQAGYIGGTVCHAAGSFDLDNFYMTVTNENIIGSPCSTMTRASFFLQPNTANHLPCFTPVYSVTVNGMNVERQYSESSNYGDSGCIYMQAQATGTNLTGPQSYTFEGVILIPAPNGYASVQLSTLASQCGASGVSPFCPLVTAVHNDVPTIPVATGFGALGGESNTGYLGLYSEIADNVFSTLTSGAGCNTSWVSGSTPVSSTFENVGNNDIYNITGSPFTSVYCGSSGWYNITPGTYGGGDISVNPQRLGCPGGLTPAIMNCNLKGWATSAGIAYTTWDDILQQFRAMNTSGALLNSTAISLEYAWVRKGFTPTNSAMHGTASAAYTPYSGVSMQDIGPVAWQPAGSVNFAGIF